MFEIYTESWEPVKGTLVPIAEKAWQLNQNSETKSQNLEHDWDALLTLATELGWSKEKEEMTRSWKE